MVTCNAKTLYFIQTSLHCSDSHSPDVLRQYILGKRNQYNCLVILKGSDVERRRWTDEQILRTYFEALDLFQSGRFEKCIEAAICNIADQRHTYFHRIKNLVLIVSSLDDWDKVDRYLRQAEELYVEADRWTSESDQEAQCNLRLLRHDLNQLREPMNEDARAELSEDEDEGDGIEPREDEDVPAGPRGEREADPEDPDENLIMEVRPIVAKEDKEKQQAGILLDSGSAVTNNTPLTPITAQGTGSTIEQPATLPECT